MTVTPEQVAESLDNAVANGYGDVLANWDAERVADDLCHYDASYEDVSPALLVPHVEAWQAARA